MSCTGNCQGVLRQDGSGCTCCPPGAAGTDGAAGLSAYEVWIDEGNTGDEQDFLDALVGPQGEPGICLCPDTGWFDLVGFAYYVGVAKPQARRIDNQVHFRGDIIIPIDDGAAGIETIVGADTYRSVLRAVPATSSGGITYDADNRLIFNNDTSVIPATVLPTLTNFDGSYESTRNFASRELIAEQTLGSGVTSTVLLNSFLRMEITSDKKLVLTALETMEQNALDSPLFDFIGGSSLRQFVSSFNGRDAVLEFTKYSNNQTGVNALGGSVRLENGSSLIVGHLYTIETFAAGDDFTNVGASVNGAYVSFIATGAAPTTWANGSVVIPGEYKVMLDAFDGTVPTSNSQFPFITATPLNGIDAANPLQIGGFKMKIDGLIAYVAP